jgi:hypothetical protein
MVFNASSGLFSKMPRVKLTLFVSVVRCMKILEQSFSGDCAGTKFGESQQRKTFGNRRSSCASSKQRSAPVVGGVL